MPLSPASGNHARHDPGPYAQHGSFSPGSQVQERDEEVAAAAAEAAGLRAERHAVDAAVEELRTMLMQSVAERTRLAAEAETAEQRIATAEQVHPPPGLSYCTALMYMRDGNFSLTITYDSPGA